MEERLITFETAKLAKEKGLTGLKWNPGKSYMYNGILFQHQIVEQNKDPKYTHYPFAISQSLLQKWLLEEHGYFVNVELAYNDWGRFSAGVYKKSKDGRTGIVAIDGTSIFDNPEDALEHGLYETLKLINEKTT